MSGHAYTFFNQMDIDLLNSARAMCEVKHIDVHPAIAILKKYEGALVEKGVHHLLRRLAADWGKLSSEFLDENTIPAAADIEDRTLQVLILLCKFVIQPPFGQTTPSENDVLALWVSIFSVLVKKITIHTGEKVMLASKTMRQMQSAEFGDTSDSGRKTDCLFMFGDIELSNIEFKKPNISQTELGVQNRKNIRLGRCLLEARAAFGVEAPSVLMADVSGYVAVFYQVVQMGNVAVAGKATRHLVHLPSTEGDLLEFLFSPSLAIIWNYVHHLEEQGPKLRRSKDRHVTAVSKAKLELGLERPEAETPRTVVRRFENNVTLSPTRKRKNSV
ncbi:hypothetical protein BC939DRAFT_524459 [Gamsiella multidivaricata]|uniref:uncharacterized protein n=1 Tax=Gamsiella multidivaricata TaxID=101098 RepID=UPI00221FF166|nr:uncharacterized protein BC939DRAFT_524459 [Gamsiella multidivaricata]KAG0354822.1 hypothetical protein BGZ54_001456 [Gamsiella multidivaricata]KAI7832849.1 hypothetical protein BC939DRAFT_524459 [Gamsiella multidivaricata]